MSEKINVIVDDPNNMISHISVVHESSGVVVLYGDMNSNGKRADILHLEKNVWELISDPDRGEYRAKMTIENLPFSDWTEISESKVSRYTFFVVLMPTNSIANGREVFRSLK